MAEIQAEPATETKAVTEAPAAQPQPVAQPQQNPDGFLAKHRVETGTTEWKDGLFDCFENAPNYLCMLSSRCLIFSR
jgi:hypothetical protein